MKYVVKDRTSLPWGGGGGVWFPAYSNITCTGKGVKILSTNQWFRITSCNELIGSAVLNHCTAPCVRPHCVCSILREHVQFCKFDKADATADVQ